MVRGAGTPRMADDYADEVPEGMSEATRRAFAGLSGGGRHAIQGRNSKTTLRNPPWLLAAAH